MKIISCWRIKHPHAAPAIRKSQGLARCSTQRSVPLPCRTSQTLLLLHCGAPGCILGWPAPCPGSAARTHCEACASHHTGSVRAFGGHVRTKKKKIFFNVEHTTVLTMITVFGLKPRAWQTQSPRIVLAPLC